MIRWLVIQAAELYRWATELKAGKRMKRVFALSIIFLAACSGKTATPSITLTVTPLQATERPTHLPSTPTTTFTSSPTPTFTPTHSSTPSPVLELAIQTVPSPDGELIAKVYQGYWHFFLPQVIEVQDRRGEVVWSVPYQGTMTAGDPHPTMRIVGWAPDGSALYFYYSWGYDGWYTLFNGFDLQMLEIETGDLKPLITGCCMAFSFLADMSKIAYTNEGRIGIYDIATGDDHYVDIRSDKIAQAGYIHWSPGGNGIVFTVLADDNGNARAIYLDVKSMRQKVLFEAFIEDFGFDSWSQTENPQYRKMNPEVGAYEVVVIDPKTNISTSIGTPTPQP